MRKSREAVLLFQFLNFLAAAMMHQLKPFIRVAFIGNSAGEMTPQAVAKDDGTEGFL
jgi:hypothetical protein